MCGASGASISTRSRTASRAPAPASRARRVSFVSSISFETAVLNLNRSRSPVTPFNVRWASRVSSCGSSPPRAAASPTARHTRPSQPWTPGGRFGLGAMSIQSMSSSNGPANSMVSRMVSAPQRSTIGMGSTMLPMLLLMDAPP